MLNRFLVSVLVFLGCFLSVSAHVEYEIIALTNRGTNFPPVINKHGYVLGVAYDESKKAMPFVYHDDFGFRLIPGLNKGVPKGVNKQGMVVGEYLHGKKTSIFIYDVHTEELFSFREVFKECVELGLINSKGPYSVLGISDQNMIVINPSDEEGDSFTYDLENGELCSLAVTEFSSLRPRAMNANGQLIGYDEILVAPQFANISRWFLDMLGDRVCREIGNMSDPIAISDEGHVVGIGFGGKAYIWSLEGGSEEIVFSNPVNNGTMAVKKIILSDGHGKIIVDMHTPYHLVHAINNKGVVIGRIGSSAQDARAYVYKDGTGGILGDLGTESHPTWINIDEQVVGWYGNRESSWSDLSLQRAFIWDDNHGMRDLTELIPEKSGWTELTMATSISDEGHIVGLGKYKGRSQAFLLRPIK